MGCKHDVKLGIWIQFFPNNKWSDDMKDLLDDLRSDITCSEAVWTSDKVIQRRYSIRLRGWRGAACWFGSWKLSELDARWLRVGGACVHVFAPCRGLIWDDEVPASKEGGGSFRRYAWSFGNDWLCQLSGLPCSEHPARNRVTLIGLDFSACYLSPSPNMIRR